MPHIKCPTDFILFIHLVGESTEHLCLDIEAELVEGQGGCPLEVGQALLGAFHVKDVSEVSGEHLVIIYHVCQVWPF